MLSILLYTLAAIFAGAYYFAVRKYNYWKKRNVPHLKPTPLLGNYGEFIRLKKHLSTVMDEMCKQFPNEPYFGAYYGTDPTLIVKDPETLKLITTKDFYYFSGRENSEYVHKELWVKTHNLFNSGGDEWRVVRQNLTPVFTSAKMKNMFYLIAKCSYEFENLIDEDTKVSNSLEIRAFFSRFTMACIASCAFGIDSDTMGKDYKDNPFTKVSDEFFGGSSSFAFKNNIRSLWPGIFYGLGYQAAPESVDKFFEKFIVSIFENRNHKPTSRNDLIDFILTFYKNNHIVGDSITNLKTGDDKKVQIPVTDKLLLAQCLVFFLAGFETSATTASYTLFELAKHPEAQKKVQEEIDAYLKKYDNKLVYEIVNELPYTYACVEEAMRLYPVLVGLTREVVEDYTLPSGVHLAQGTRVHIPVYHLHRQAKFFPEPEVYRPERFLGEERRNIIPYSYMPFGEGSRICIGMRFAKMQVLAGLVTILKKNTVKLDASTPLKPTFNPLLLIPTPNDPLKVEVHPREGWEGRRFNQA
uniref:unspecific monooxygenase n=1 Tax=Maruca vitrata TaxID=497515 RepID=A0AAU7NKI2_MARVT